ncbi:outer membrane lipoprotein carrier protein LolA [Saprospira sp. CCB-QB6]|uniref:LolA family protein n=1 Tax=Saprospira sp. CCB-QB6 TaxID=3023936 RepID=UPI00234B985B|nr:outer membrane lipoprotein carrier protein LolA [Saprospira sp. CCB-QB6]WCL81837.1 outer membrane lipoprotein carrier protein LolA [Saprospira sp. CCB-QB6]
MRTIKLLFAFCLMMTFGLNSLQAQTPFFKKALANVEKSDPAAKKVLEKLKKKYTQYNAIYAEYELLIDNRETQERQQGQITQEGDKFHVNNNGNEIYCDGSTLWMYMKNNNELQINDYEPEDEDMMSPSKIMKIYEAEDEFFYALTQERGDICEIEFKPHDKDADFFKIRATIDRAKPMVNEIKVFAKDGTIYTLDIKVLKAAQPKASDFVFDKTKYPGIREVDMR